MTVRYDTVQSRFGEILLAADDDGLCRLTPLSGQWKGRGDLPPSGWVRDHTFLKEAGRQLEAYLKGELKNFSLRLNPVGTDFQKQVWAELQRIPYGETRSYAGIAAAVGKPKAFQAVGQANANNPLAIVVPCHRVISSNGGLAGYAGGDEMKAWLLKHEGVPVRMESKQFALV